jgi:hypothetical protein
MGVRFECPAGHKLHVKAELAGKRGICPECGAKFIVPSFSGQRVAEENGAATGSTIVVNSPPAPSAVATATPPPLTQAPAITSPPALEPAAWYIRPASGGQFGPASDEVFAQWIAEGRVSSDSWVWRNGWTDWRAGGDALREFGVRAALGPAVAMAAADVPQIAGGGEAAVSVVVAAPKISPAAATASVDAATAEARRAEIARRKKKVRNLSILLGVVALAMLVALVAVLAK